MLTITPHFFIIYFDIIFTSQLVNPKYLLSSDFTTKVVTTLPFLITSFMEFVQLLVFKIKTKQNYKFQEQDLPSFSKLKRKVKIYSFGPDM